MIKGNTMLISLSPVPTLWNLLLFFSLTAATDSDHTVLYRLRFSPLNSI